MLGIPTVIDRLLQQAIAQWLSPRYEEEFSKYSYGFREGRNAHQAVLQAQKNLNEGHEWIIELDLEKFFDRVNHDKLMGLLTKKDNSQRHTKANTQLSEQWNYGRRYSQSADRRNASG